MLMSAPRASIALLAAARIRATASSSLAGAVPDQPWVRIRWRLALAGSCSDNIGPWASRVEGPGERSDGRNVPGERSDGRNVPGERSGGRNVPGERSDETT